MRTPSQHRLNRRSVLLGALGGTGLLLSNRLVAALSAAQGTDEVPGAPQSRPIAMIGGTVHPVSGPEIPNGIVLFDAGRIVAVGTDVAIPPTAERLDVSGKHVYPGLFESHSRLGLTEWASVRAMNDFAETGDINPNVTAGVAVNPESSLIPVTRANGVLLALSAPAGGLISGCSTVLQLDGWTNEELALLPVAGLQVSWPSISPPLRLPGVDSGARPGGGGDANAALQRLRQFFDQARAYIAAVDSEQVEQAFDLRLEAMRPVLDRSIPMVVAADSLGQIESAVAFAVEQNVRLVIFGGYDAPHAAELLKQHQISVIVSGVHRMPLRDDAYDGAYTLPERLRAAGIDFCISGSARSETYNARNLAYHAATAVAYGLPADKALESITLAPARIFGLQDRVGSLDPGKDATLIVTDGDPLETTTQVEQAFIQGRSVQLTSLHTRLRDKYLEKYRQGR